MGRACGRLPLEPMIGHLIIDVVDGAVAQIEVLYRDEIRQKLLKIFPDKS
jgi:hypothetical protein